MFKRKGGGAKGLLNNVKKNCTFLKGWHPLLALLALPVSIVLLALLCDFWWSLLLSNWKNIAFLTQSYRFGCLSVNSSHMRHRSQCEASWGTPHISTCFQPESVKTNQQIVKPEWAKVWSQLWVHLQPFFLALSAYFTNFRQKIQYFDVSRHKKVLFNCFATKQC